MKGELMKGANCLQKRKALKWQTCSSRLKRKKLRPMKNEHRNTKLHRKRCIKSHCTSYWAAEPAIAKRSSAWKLINRHKPYARATKPQIKVRRNISPPGRRSKTSTLKLRNGKPAAINCKSNRHCAMGLPIQSDVECAAKPPCPECTRNAHVNVRLCDNVVQSTPVQQCCAT